jgi:peptidoglycan-N-acetylglucosamine deacetylase
MRARSTKRATEPRLNAKPELVVTTSWDDGHVLDTRLAEMLERYRLAATFYIAPKNVEIDARKRLTPSAIRDISTVFEVGGHTLSHLRLTTLSDEAARREIGEGKDWLEQVIGSRLTSFCYPGGRYACQHLRMVSDAGFTTARTVRRGAINIAPGLEMHTTVHAYRHLVDIPGAVALANRRVGICRTYWNWDDAAIAMFTRARNAGGVFSLWGHSWEIERNRDWVRLERVLEYISGRAGIAYVTNGEVGAALAAGNIGSPTGMVGEA